MATVFTTSSSFSHSSCPLKKNPFAQNAHGPFSLSSTHQSKRFPKLIAKSGQEKEQLSSPSSVAVAPKKPETQKGEVPAEGALRRESELEDGEREKRQKLDWKTDEKFEKFMGNPWVEAAIKLEKKRADSRLKELDRESSNNPILGLFYRLVRDNLAREKEMLEKAEEAFKALDLNKLKSCSGFDKFFATTDVRRFGDGGIFSGNSRKPIEEVIPKLEQKLSDEAGREVVIWLMEEKINDITKQVLEDHES